MTDFKIATWNINSVRLRADQVVRFLNEQQPDVLCLQEIKCQDFQFPKEAFEAAGYPHQEVSGQKSYNGVATISKHPLTRLSPVAFCRNEHARHLATKVGNVELHNFYIPAGGDIPDPEKNEKFDHKLDFLACMTDYYKDRKKAGDDNLVLVGDFNIAPHENDVWSHKQLLKVVSHTPIEVETLAKLQGAHDFIDTARAYADDEEKMYSWWSYRSPDWTANNRGRRLDHIWVSPALGEAIKPYGRDGHQILTECRSWDKPSDHAPVMQSLKV